MTSRLFSPPSHLFFPHSTHEILNLLLLLTSNGNRAVGRSRGGIFSAAEGICCGFSFFNWVMTFFLFHSLKSPAQPQLHSAAPHLCFPLPTPSAFFSSLEKIGFTSQSEMDLEQQILGWFLWMSQLVLEYSESCRSGSRG